LLRYNGPVRRNFGVGLRPLVGHDAIDEVGVDFDFHGNEYDAERATRLQPVVVARSCGFG
jgi:hypothetical protein